MSVKTYGVGFVQTSRAKDETERMRVDTRQELGSLCLDAGNLPGVVRDSVTRSMTAWGVFLHTIMGHPLPKKEDL